MTGLRRLAVGIGAAVLLLAAPGGPGPLPAAADCPSIGIQVPGLDGAQGTTFIGVPVAQEWNREGHGSIIEWRIDRVFAGSLERGRHWTTAEPCIATTPMLGARYLVTTETPRRLDPGRTITWRLEDGGRLTLEPQYMGRRDYPAEVRRIQTVTDALDAVAPGWSGWIPKERRRSIARIPGQWTGILRAPVPVSDAHLAWTGMEAVAVAPGAAAAWDPTTNDWRALAPPPVELEGLDAGVSVWTGSELLVWGPAGSAGGGLALDPATGAWRTLPTVPVEGEVVATVWAGDRAVIVTDQRQTAEYLPGEDAWTALRPLFAWDPQPADPTPWRSGRLLWTGGSVVLVDPEQSVDGLPRVWRLVPETGGWTEVGVTSYPDADPAAATVDGRLVFSGPAVMHRDAGPTVEWLDPESGDRERRAADCRVDVRNATMAGSWLVGHWFVLHPQSGRCAHLPGDSLAPPPGAVQLWTGSELLRWSGTSGWRFTPDHPDLIVRRPSG
jgi:hypothetical protein